MKSGNWLILSVAFGTLILLIALLGFGAVRQAQALHDETVSAQEVYLRTDAVLREIPSELYLGGILIRDYLLDNSPERAALYREQLLARRAMMLKRLDSLAPKPGEREAPGLRRLRTELQAYWESREPILSWTPEEKRAYGWGFLRHQVLPRRDAIIKLARSISEINETNLRNEQQRLQRSQDAFRAFLIRTAFLALSLGLVVAVASTVRVATLELRSDEQRLRAEHAEAELRRLSRQLVRAQEEERRSLSLELHDAIGQMLSAMTMELGNLESLIASDPGKLRERLDEARRLNAETIRGVRNLAMGLRPAMLDELGLAPALRWQGREFSRRSGVPVTVQIDGDLEELPETHRTCIYRVVQEALTNCARHAHATSIRVSVYGGRDWVRLSIQDDGVGFDPPQATSRGLGLIGIQERVRELEGKVEVISQHQKGTILEVEVPVPGKVALA